MGLCRKNKAKAPSKRARAVQIEEAAPSAVGGDVPREEPAVVEPEEETREEVMATPRSVNDRIVQKDDTQPADSRASPSRDIGPAGTHGRPPPTRHDSAATSCAGMTDAEYLSRRGTLQAEQQPAEEPAAAQPADDARESSGNSSALQSHREKQPPPSARKEEPRHAPLEADDPAGDTPRKAHESPTDNSDTSKEAPEKHATPEDDDQASEPPSDDFSSRMHNTFTNVKQSLSRGYESLRSVHISESFRRPATADYADMHPAEQCFYGVLNDITELGERALPCVLGDSADGETEARAPPMPQIVMVVDTPGGPYIRHIPDDLVGDAINMGFITDDEVQRQREEWERNHGRIPIEYTPAISFAQQEASA